MSAASTLVVPTPVGDARVHLHEPPARPRSTVVLGHGAGGGIEARDLVALASGLPALGHRVVLVEQPWRVAGRRLAPAPAALDQAWLAVLGALRAHGTVGEEPLVVGGRSAGARVACRTAAEAGADAVLALAFPLHPPGRPERSRAGELTGVAVPVLVVQGERDPFGGPAELRSAAPGVAVRPVPGADHGLKIPRTAPCTQEEGLALVVESAARALAEWRPRASR